MFILISQAKYLKEATRFAPYLVAGSCIVFSVTTSVAGLSVWLIPVVALPLVEFLLRFRHLVKGLGPFIPTLLILMLHPLLLSLVQHKTVGVVRLAVNFQYLSLLVGALGIGAYLFQTDILAEEEPL